MGAVRGCFARWLSGERGGKRAVKHGKSVLRAAIYALFGTLRGDLCKTVEKLCKSLQGVKTKITNCAQRFVRLCVLVRELCKYRFLSAFGVWALRCGGAPFGRFPSRLRRRGAHLGGGGGAVGGQGLGRRRGKCGALREGASAFAFALPHPALGGAGHGATTAGIALCTPPLRTVIRHTSGRGTAVGGESAGCCAKVRPPLPSPSPTLRSAARDTGSQRRDLFPTAARTLPGAADGRTIYYIYACAGARASTFCTGRRATMWITFPWITHCG